MPKNKTILEIRRRLNITQAELAQRLHITHTFVSYLENNKRIPSSRVALLIKKIAHEVGLDISLDDIYSWKATNPPRKKPPK